MPTVSQIIEILSRRDPNEVIAVSIWSREDAQTFDIEVSDEQADAAIEAMHDDQDASIGMNWDVLLIHVESVTNQTI